MPTFRVTAPDGKTYDVTGPDGATAEQALAQVQAQVQQPASAPSAEPGGVMQRVGNLAAGAVRGAGSIGSTLMRAMEAKPIGLGEQGGAARDAARRADMDAGLQQLGAQPDSFAYGAGKLVGEVAGTMGAGGAIANGAARVPGLAAAAPNLLNSIRTSGMTAGAQGGAQNALLRATGGVVAGGSAAGLVDPTQAGVGAAVGGVLPATLQGVGKLGHAVGGAIRGPVQPADVAQAVTAARSAGYVVPPTQANPSLRNRLMEGVAGKITTAQNASARNQAVTNAKAVQALGLPADTRITPDVLKTVRDDAAQAYNAIRSTTTVTPIVPGPAYAKALDAIEAPHLSAQMGFPRAAPSPVLQLVSSLRSTSFSADAALSKIASLRSTADDAYRAGNTEVGRASKAAAAALEDSIEAHLQTTGQQALLGQFRDARTRIAKSYSVEKALNAETGTVDARKLASQLQRGKPLTNELREAASFAARFPKAAQTPEAMGSLPGTSPLDWHASGAVALGTGNPLAMLGAAVRPAARAAALSPMVQNRLLQQPNVLQQLLMNPVLGQAAYRAAPATAADR